MQRTYSTAIIGLAIGFAVVGCSSEKLIEVTGKVTYNGSPLKKPGGKIIFVGPNGTEAIATIAEDGTYQATKVSVGKNRIAVYYTNPDAANNKRLPDPKKKKAAAPASNFLTPQKYASADTSELSKEITEGATFDTNLVGPKIP